MFIVFLWKIEGRSNLNRNKLNMIELDVILKLNRWDGLIAKSKWLDWMFFSLKTDPSQSSNTPTNECCFSIFLTGLAPLSRTQLAWWWPGCRWTVRPRWLSGGTTTADKRKVPCGVQRVVQCLPSSNYVRWGLIPCSAVQHTVQFAIFIKKFG